MTTEEPVRQRPHYAFWLLGSIPLAILVDVVLTGLARFAWCGFDRCLYPSTAAESMLNVVLTSSLLFGILLVTSLALALPPWIPGWRRPVIAAAAGLAAVAVASAVVFGR